MEADGTHNIDPPLGTGNPKLKIRNSNEFNIYQIKNRARHPLFKIISLSGIWRLGFRVLSNAYVA
jgi:hypothetical protein